MTRKRFPVYPHWLDTMDTESASSSHSSAESDPSSSEVSLEYDSSSFTSEAGSSSDPEVLPFMYEPVVASDDEGVHPRLLNLDW